MSVRESKTILLVEDDAITAMMETVQLEKEGYCIIHSTNGEQALELAADNSNPIDLILMDIDLGRGIDGTETAKRILQQRDLPILFLSSHTEKEIVDKTEKISSYGYVVKNSSITVLNASIKMAFRLFDANQRIKNELTQRKRIEEELTESEKRYKELIENINEIVYLYSTERGALYWSPKVEKILGYTPDDLLKNPRLWHNSIHPEDISKVDSIIKEFFEGNTFQIEYRIQDKAGNWHWFLDQSIGRVTKDKEIIISGTARDITESKQAELQREKNEEFFSTIYLNSDLSVFIVDLMEDGEYIYEGINPAHEKIMGITNDQIVGKKPSELSDHFGRDTIDYVIDLYDECVREKKSVKSEFYISEGIAKGWWLSSLMPIFDEKSRRVVKIFGSTLDITDRKQMEEALRISEVKYKTLFEVLPVGISVSDSSGNILESNKLAETILGLSKNEQTKRKIDGKEWNIVRTDGSPMPAEEFASTIALNTNRLTQNIEMGIVKGDDNIVWISVSAVPIPLEGYGVAIAYIDFTQRKLMEKNLNENKQLLTLFLKHSPIYAYIKEVKEDESRVLYASDKFRDMLGITGSEMAEKTMYELFPAEFAAKITSDDWKVVDNDGLLKVEESFNNRHYITYKFPIIMNNRKLLAGYTIDVTESIQSENELRKTKEYLENLIGYANAPIIVWDMQYIITRFNRAFQQLTGIAESEALGKSLSILFPDEQKDAIMDMIRSSSGEKWETVDIPILNRKTGEIRTVLWNSAYIYGEDDTTIEATIAQGTDITERKRAEKELKESEARFKALHNASFGGIAIHDKGLILDCNQGLAEMTGYSIDELMGMDGLLLIAESKRDLVMSSILSDTEKPYEAIGKRKNGEEFPLQLEARNIPYKGKIVRVVEFRNVSEIKMAEKAIIALLNEKEMILKETHHRVKNNMNTIISLLTIQARYQDNPAFREKLEDAAGRIRSMMMLYDKLYRSESHNELSLKVYLPPLVDEIVKVFPTEVAITTEVKVDDIVLNASLLTPIGIIVNELITNSMKYAFSQAENGRIAITASQTEGFVTIVYEDNGIGLPETVSFEKTTGFGMQLIGMLVKQIKASVRIERNGGTRFVIEFKA